MLLRLPLSPAAGRAVRAGRNSLLPLCLVAAALAGGVQVAAAGEGLTIANPWMRFIIAARPAAGYFTLNNGTDKAVSLTAAASPACGKIMLHHSVQQNGQDMMVMVKSISVPAHGELKFAPGGYHLMCMQPAKTMKPGTTVPVTLSFADGSAMKADFPVRGMNSQ